MWIASVNNNVFLETKRILNTELMAAPSTFFPGNRAFLTYLKDLSNVIFILNPFLTNVFSVVVSAQVVQEADKELSDRFIIVRPIGYDEFLKEEWLLV